MGDFKLALTIMFVTAVIFFSKIMWDKYQIKKNPHMNINFFKKSAAVVGVTIIEIDESLQLHLEDMMHLNAKVYHKSAEGELNLLEAATYWYDQKKPLKFKGPWHQKIEHHMRIRYAIQKK